MKRILPLMAFLIASPAHAFLTEEEVQLIEHTLWLGMSQLKEMKLPAEWDKGVRKARDGLNYDLCLSRNDRAYCAAARAELIEAMTSMKGIEPVAAQERISMEQIFSQWISGLPEKDRAEASRALSSLRRARGKAVRCAKLKIEQRLENFRNNCPGGIDSSRHVRCFFFQSRRLENSIEEIIRSEWATVGPAWERALRGVAVRLDILGSHCDLDEELNSVWMSGDRLGTFENEKELKLAWGALRRSGMCVSTVQ